MTIWGFLSLAVRALGLFNLAEKLWAKHEQKKEIENAVKPYQKELEIKSRPAGSDDDVINRL